jgi:hypothetical protein
LSALATEILEFLEGASKRAARERRSHGPVGDGALAAGNTLNDERPLRQLHAIRDEEQRALAHLEREPAIARVEVLEDGDRSSVIYFARVTPPSTGYGNALHVSYRAPIGRLAALPVGEEQEINIPSGTRHYEVTARATLQPLISGGVWDSRDNQIYRGDGKALTIASLRAFLASLDVEELDLLERALKEDRDQAAVFEGVRRAVIEKMGLRDRPLLDKFQDEIFRLPLSSRLAVMGPPGSGKTTTLIKRLGLKLDLQWLEESEGRAVERSLAGVRGHPQSWLMFTPSDLLKQYVKEAFNRERIPAPDYNIQTWDDFRLETARNKLQILRTATGSGAVLRPNLLNLSKRAITNQRGWFEAFEKAQAGEFWARMKESASLLAAHERPEIARVGASLVSTIDGRDEAAPAVSLAAIDALAAKLVELARDLAAGIQTELRRAFSHELQNRPQLLEELSGFVESLEEPSDDSDDLDGEDAEADDEAEAPQAGTREKAFAAYVGAMRANARALAAGRKLPAGGRNGRIVAWMGPRIPPSEELKRLGEEALTLSALRRFANPARAYVAQMPIRYRRYRRRADAGVWYEHAAHTRDMSPIEVDLVMLAMLRSANELVRNQEFARRIDEPRLGVLRTVRDLVRSQIVVDEATDFGPIQLACMWMLSDPSTASFLACGDFNQRVTRWGSRSEQDLKWAIPGIDIREMVVSYRHSRQLNELAHRLSRLSGGVGTRTRLPTEFDNEGVAPVFARNLSGTDLSTWLAQRIVEVEMLTGSLPSIAVLVNNEDEVVPLATSLDAALTASNIRCEACPGGLARGQDNDVRVFDVRHIKGLEFEAVFFVGVDELARREPDLFDKFLYVGATRAATYLGLTCVGAKVPPGLADLQDLFGTDWRT